MTGREQWLLANETSATSAYQHGFDEGRAAERKWLAGLVAAATALSAHLGGKHIEGDSVCTLTDHDRELYRALAALKEPTMTPVVDGCICQTCSARGEECEYGAESGQDECDLCKRGRHVRERQAEDEREADDDLA